jgi:hypothetical protein
MMARSMHKLLSALALWAAVVLTLCPATADAQDQPARRAQTYAERQDRINAWTVGLAAGLIEGAPLRLATEMSRVKNRAGPAGRFLQMAGRHRRTAQLTTPEQP